MWITKLRQNAFRGTIIYFENKCWAEVISHAIQRSHNRIQATLIYLLYKTICSKKTDKC